MLFYYIYEHSIIHECLGDLMDHEKVYTITGVDCAVCAARIEKALNTISHINTSEIDIIHEKLRIHTSEDLTPELEKTIQDTIDHVESGVIVTTEELGKTEKSDTITAVGNSISLIVPVRVLVSLAAVGAAWFVTNPQLSFMLFIGAYLLVGYEVVLQALRNIFRGSVFDENFLMTIATLGALIIGEYAEAVAVMAFYQVGEYFQNLAVHRSRKSIAELMDIKPLKATIIKNAQPIVVTPEEISVGDVILIRAGEKIPVDCRVVSGTSTLDTRALTGESVPKMVEPDDELLSGSVNGSGVLHAIALKRYSDSTVASLLKLVEESGRRKAKAEQFITKFARYYTPSVVFLALALSLFPPLFNQGSFSTWIYRALVFLVISCPCALVISVPLGFFAGIGGLAKMGVMVKGGSYIQTLAKTKQIVFDKTGTLTEGTYTVSEIRIDTQSELHEKDIILYAQAVESSSHHPIAKALSGYAQELYEQNLEASSVKEIPGKGMIGIVDNHTIIVGTDKLMMEHNLSVPKELGGSDVASVLIAINQRVYARVLVADSVKREAKRAIASLKELGIRDIRLLSGDTHSVVQKLADSVGINNFIGELLPHQKVDHVENLLKENYRDGSLAFIGDGINDAPVLARADVGISMGTIGSDAAVEASDVVIMTDNLMRIPQSIRHARKIVSIVTQNIVFAIAIKVLVMILGAFGFASMWMAVFADTGVALLAVFNSLRALFHE